MQPLNEALSIMAVGMITVFFILFLIILIGNLIIRLSNRYLPEEATVVKTKKVTASSDNKLKAIEAAIDVITKGRGKITNIKKL